MNQEKTKLMILNELAWKGKVTPETERKIVSIIKRVRSESFRFSISKGRCRYGHSGFRLDYMHLVFQIIYKYILDKMAVLL